MDTLRLLVLIVHAANLQDYEGARLVVYRIRENYRRPRLVFADNPYGKGGLPDWAKLAYRVLLKTILQSVNVKEFVVLPKHNIEEHAFTWMNRFRRLSEAYERLVENFDAAMNMAMIDLMVNRFSNRKSAS